MRQLTEAQIRGSMINCSRGEATGLTLPRDLRGRDCGERVFLGWRDPKAPQRGYLVQWVDDRVVGVALRAAESRMSHRVAAMCLLCHSVHTGGDVSLFTARLAGPAGRDGNTIGTYICADLSCGDHIKVGAKPTPDQPDPVLVVEERRAGLVHRLEAFIDQVGERARARQG